MKTIFYVKTDSPKNYQITNNELFYIFEENFDENGESIHDKLIPSYMLSIMEELIHYQHLYKHTNDFITGFLEKKNLIKENDSENTIELKKNKTKKIIDELLDKKIITKINKLDSDEFYTSEKLKNIFLKTTYSLEFKNNTYTLSYFKDLENQKDKIELECKKEEYLFLISLKNETMMEAYYDFKTLIEQYGDVFYNDYEIHNLFFNYTSKLNMFFEVDYKESKLKTRTTSIEDKYVFSYNKDSVTLLPIGNVYKIINKYNEYIYIHKSKRNKIQEIEFKEFYAFDFFNEIFVSEHSLNYFYKELFLETNLFESLNDFEKTIENMYRKKMIVDFNDNAYQLLSNHSFSIISKLKNKLYDISISISDNRENLLIPISRYKDLFLSIDDSDIIQTEIYTFLKIKTANDHLIDIYFLKDLTEHCLYLYKEILMKGNYEEEMINKLIIAIKRDIHTFIHYNLFDIVIN